MGRYAASTAGTNRSATRRTVTLLKRDVAPRDWHYRADMTGWRRAADGLLAAACLAAVEVQVLNPSDDPDQSFEQPALSAVLMLAAIVPIAVRRLRPLTMGVAFAAGVGLQALVTLDFAASPGLFLSGLVVLYAVGRYAELRPGVLVLVAVMSVLVGRDLLSAPRTELDLWNALTFHALLLLSFAVGSFRRTRVRAAHLEAAAVDHAGAVAEERARIARELHDIVAHNMSAAVVQAEAAEEVLIEQPEQARQALRRVQGTSREALTEVRRLVGAMRAEDGAPPRGVADIGPLVSELAADGLRVTLVMEGDPRALPPGVDLSVYRVAQEALTNVRRHAGRNAAVVVRLVTGASSIEVDVTNGGAGDPEPSQGDGNGHGLIGMRERALFFGGTFEAGPRPEGGFRVRATFPLPASA